MNFGRYNVISELGQGGMASVYLGEDPVLDRLVAIKVIKAQLLNDPGLLSRFSIEAKTIAALRNPNIVEIFDFDVQEGQPYFILEYMDNHSLQGIISFYNNRPLPQELSAAIICQAAEGLVAAESKQVVHRDIKPENLMFNSDGFLKIADFGIAHLADDQSRTATGTILGSPSFMSPEQIEGEVPGVHTDMWALGAVFFTCLTGRQPFTGPSITSTMRNICDKPLKPVMEIIPQADALIIKLIDTLLQKDITLRGNGPKWLAATLRTYLSQRGITNLQDYTKSFLNTLQMNQEQTLVDQPDLTQNSPPPLRPGTPFSTIPDSSSLTKEPAKSKSNKTGRFFLAGTILTIGMALLLAFFWIQNHDKSVPKKPPERYQLALNHRKLSLFSGETTQLQVRGIPQDTLVRLVWSSSRPEIFSVKNGLVKGLGLGRGIVTVSATTNSPTSAVCSVYVKTKKHRSPTKSPRITKTSKEPKRTTSTSKKIPGGIASIKVHSSPPFAVIKLDGKVWDETPMTSYRKLKAGKHRIELIHKLYSPVDTIFEIKNGKSRYFKLRLN
ncbi:MAG: protein kinase [Fibrobacteria bacterium]|nr:protein kinase [Fibrobacteria bacterium]